MPMHYAILFVVGAQVQLASFCLCSRVYVQMRCSGVSSFKCL
jgi:hypothetical protein